MTMALDNIVVLDLTRVLAGPYCTMILADLGAEVIKIERPDAGDDSRSFPPFKNGESGYYMSLNRNKKGITMDLKSHGDREAFIELVKQADVVVENFRPGTMERLGLGYETLKQINKKIVYAAISGFGQDGPLSQKPAYDLIVQGMGGLMGLTAHPGGMPTRVGSAIGDIAAGMFAAIGILAALNKRNETGKGQMVDVSMLDCQVALLENAIARYSFSGKNPEPTGNRHPSIAPFQSFPTKDGHVIAAAGNNSLWEKFCQAVGAEHLLNDDRFVDNSKRVDNIHELQEELDIIFKQKTSQEWMAILSDAGVPNGPISTVEEVVNNPQVLYREMVLEVEHPMAGTYLTQGIPIKLSDMKKSNISPPPTLGQHNEEIRVKYLGKSEKKVKII